MTTANMGLTYVESGDSAYAWSETWNSNFEIMDAHDHSTGNGVSISIGSITVIADIDISDYVTNAYSYTFENKTTYDDISTTLQCVEGELVYVDYNRRLTQITSGGSLNYSSELGGGFSGLYSAESAECYYQSGGYLFCDSTVSADNYQAIDAVLICNTFSNTTYDTDYLYSTSSFTCYATSSNMNWSFPSGDSVVLKYSEEDGLVYCAAGTESYIVQTDGGTELYDSLYVLSTTVKTRLYGSTFILNSGNDRYWFLDVIHSVSSEAPTSTYPSFLTFYSSDLSVSSVYNVSVDFENDLGPLYLGTGIWSVYLPTSSAANCYPRIGQIILSETWPTSTSDYFLTALDQLLVPCDITDSNYFFESFNSCFRTLSPPA